MSNYIEMPEAYEILMHWNSDDGITFHDPSDDDTWYNFATGIYHPTAKIKDIHLAHVGKNKEESSNHIGSGRYPKGSGKDPFQHNNNEFYKTYRRLSNSGMSRKDICEYFGMSERDLRSAVTIGKKNEIETQQKLFKKWYDEGMSVKEISEKSGVQERTVYLRLNPKDNSKRETLDAVTERLANEMERKRYLDIGEGVETNLGVSKERLAAAVKNLTDTGEYVVLPHYTIEQPTNPGKYTTIKILAPAGTTYADIKNNLSELKSVDDYYPKDEDVGKNKVGIHDPEAIDHNRVYIRYSEDGGKDRDGTIELRRGVDDLSLGDSQYAQVRIATDNGLFLKGVALYNKDIPEGYDIVFNTNKPKGTPMEDVLKKLKDDKDNPFGATIKSQKGALNIVNEEGDWNEWSRSLSSQFLSKQPQELIEKQLNLAYQQQVDEFNTILSIPNPTVRKILLKEFADSCDGASVDMKGAAIPGQANRLILPLPNLKDTEVFAPGYKDGTTVVLVRHPHAGTFELPRLIVNNKNEDGREIIGNSTDAIGINPKVAQQLSGADFDGDTVVVLPENKNIKFTTRRYLDSLANFSTDDYALPPDATKVVDQKGWNKQMEMGKISNLITDMTLRGAPDDEVARAVKHSMVIIDAEKHNLNWQKSYEDNKISDLKILYQGGKNRGASTLISKAGGEADIPERKQVYLESAIDPETGKIQYKFTDRTIKKKIFDEETGKNTYVDTGVKATEKTTKLEKIYLEGGTAYDLSSGHPKEIAYARYSDNLRELANQARIQYLNASRSEEKRDPEAAKIFNAEVASLKEKLLIAQKNAPRERQATVLANLMIKAQIDANPELNDRDNKDILSRTKAQRMAGARLMVGASKTKVTFTPEEWEAVEANAISPTHLERLLNNADMDAVKKLAIPHQSTTLPPSKINLIKSMSASGYTTADIAERLDLSPNTVSKAIHSRNDNE